MYEQPEKLAQVQGRNTESAVKREKSWDECGIEEKVERIRMQLRQYRDMSHYVARTASAAKDIAERHQHNHATGEVLQPLQRHGGAESVGSSNFDPLR